jgi:hypothetical protein
LQTRKTIINFKAVKNILAVLIIIIVPCSTIVAQHQPVVFGRAGVGLQTAWTDDDHIAFFPAITIGPVVRMIQEKEFTLTISAPVSFGFTTKSDTYAGFDLPAMIDINTGAAADNNSKSKVGFVAGAGVAYFYITNYYDEELFKKIHTEFWGLRYEAGISLGKSGDKALLLVSYGKSLRSNAGEVIGIHIQKEF